MTVDNDDDVIAGSEPAAHLNSTFVPQSIPFAKDRWNDHF